MVHPALAEPRSILNIPRRMSLPISCDGEMMLIEDDILPEEVPLQAALERTIYGTLRAGETEREVARELRFLSKQGAPIGALEEVLQSAIIVQITPWMRAALFELYDRIPKWVECIRENALQ